MDIMHVRDGCGIYMANLRTYAVATSSICWQGASRTSGKRGEAALPRLVLSLTRHDKKRSVVRQRRALN